MATRGARRFQIYKKRYNPAGQARRCASTFPMKGTSAGFGGVLVRWRLRDPLTFDGIHHSNPTPSSTPLFLQGPNKNSELRKATNPKGALS